MGQCPTLITLLLSKIVHNKNQPATTISHQVHKHHHKKSVIKHALKGSNYNYEALNQNPKHLMFSIVYGNIISNLTMIRKIIYNTRKDKV